MNNVNKKKMEIFERLNRLASDGVFFITARRHIGYYGLVETFKEKKLVANKVGIERMEDILFGCEFKTKSDYIFVYNDALVVIDDTVKKIRDNIFLTDNGNIFLIGIEPGGYYRTRWFTQEDSKVLLKLLNSGEVRDIPYVDTAMLLLEKAYSRSNFDKLKHKYGRVDMITYDEDGTKNFDSHSIENFTFDDALKAISTRTVDEATIEFEKRTYYLRIVDNAVPSISHEYIKDPLGTHFLMEIEAE